MYIQQEVEFDGFNGVNVDFLKDAGFYEVFKDESKYH